MRWLFLFVFTLNLAYIAWGISTTSEVRYPDVRALKNVPPIILLSELKQPPAAVELAQAEAVQIEELHDSAVSVAPEQSPIEVAASPEVVAASDKTVAAAEVVAAVDKATVRARADQCFTLGPFRDIDKLRSLTRDIKSYVVSAEFRSSEEKEQSMYWVYLPPEPGYPDAVALGKRLKDKQIKDFFIIRDGEKKHGLSLGYYKNKDGAYGLVDKVRKLGFKVEIEPVFKTYTNYWLDYQLADGAETPEAVLEKYAEAKMDRQARNCAE